MNASIGELCALAGWLTETELFEREQASPPKRGALGDKREAERTQQGVLRLLLRHHRLDEAAARAATRTLPGKAPALLSVVDRLADACFEMHAGEACLRLDPVSSMIARSVDPDMLVMLDGRCRRSRDDRFDGSSVPVVGDGDVAGVLAARSTESHIHIGGALAPAYYWVALMGGRWPLGNVGFLVREGQDAWGSTERARWVKAICRAVYLRYLLAHTLQSEGAFAFLPEVKASAWRAFDGSQPLASPLQLQLQLGRLGPGRLHRWDGPRSEVFFDPLAAGTWGRVDVHPLAGERRLLFCLAQRLRQAEQRGSPELDLERTLLEYVRIRSAFYLTLTYQLDDYGLMRFVHVYSRRSFLNHGRRKRNRQARRFLLLERARVSTALETQLSDAFRLIPGSAGGSRRVELRGSLERGRLALRTLHAWLAGVGDYLSAHRTPQGGVPEHSVGFVIHFIKKSKGARARAEADGLVLETILGHYPRLRPYLTGIDAAGGERDAPPRAFAKPYHQLHKLVELTHPRPGEPPVRLGWTYHAGEDPWDLLTGIRHIHEATTLLFDGPGRIGHGLALGDDPERFYLRRGGFTEPPIAMHLLDLVWAWGLLRQQGLADHAQRFESRAEELGAVRSVRARMERCWRMMGETLPGGRVRSEEELVRVLTRSAPHGAITFRPEGAWLTAMRVLQDWLLEELARHGVAVEVNPTSNLMIGNYRSYADLPYIRMVEAGVSVSINTDNPGLVATTLPAEYERLFHGLGLPRGRALEWLMHREEEAARASFLRGTPGAQEALEQLTSGLPALFRFV